MKTLSLDTNTMSPWADIHRLLSNAKSLRVHAGGRIYRGEATLDDDNGHLTLNFVPRRLSVDAKGKKAKK